MKCVGYIKTSFCYYFSHLLLLRCQVLTKIFVLLLFFYTCYGMVLQERGQVSVGCQRKGISEDGDVWLWFFLVEGGEVYGFSLMYWNHWIKDKGNPMKKRMRIEKKLILNKVWNDFRGLLRRRWWLHGSSFAICGHFFLQPFLQDLVG